MQVLEKRYTKQGVATDTICAIDLRVLQPDTYFLSCFFSHKYLPSFLVLNIRIPSRCPFISLQTVFNTYTVTWQKRPQMVKSKWPSGFK